MKNDANKLPLLVTVGTALLVVGVVMVGRLTNRVGVTDPRVRVLATETEARATVRRQQGYQLVQVALTGEVATTALRVQEATALVTAAGLLLAVEGVGGRTPATVNDLLAALVQRGLLPPGMQVERGAVQTGFSTLSLHYRVRPLGVEVRALPQQQAAGQAVLVRIPTDERTNTQGIWTAQSLTEVQLPAPFADAAELIALGWQAEAVPPVR